ncbi:imidazole glycerol phosphate synthase subunit HisF [Pseudomonas sp. KBW05]|uniref:imidazole glycerol phosphate synthase subunit HisF n=1 Tax=Pseudomonas sp. KBW05 TaxID=2153360 RepID=UPI000F59670F|nr:imidazole glycerol phosphate synthase cyclase subunit [Pseudomonas sp. KBW05]RQO49946.1 imidazole glycerol phosphate synthase subunit HisF [Pseudomonas sp. KBW05]
MRVIAKLDVKPPYVVKPVHFEGLRKVGTPEELVAQFYQQGADEIFYIDIVASLYRREVLYDYIEAAARKLLVPFAVGGGVRSVEDFSRLFHHGADKVVVNTGALEVPAMIDDAAKIFGGQSVVVNIEAKSIGDQKWVCYTDCGRISSGRDVVQWAKEVELRGAGEILLQSVDCDGRQRGFDIALVKVVVDAVNIPVVAASGAGTLEHILEVAQVAAPSGIALASVLHYQKTTIADVKRFLIERGVEVRV